MEKMCCIIGLTGAGKSTYLDYILKYKNDHGLNDINRLIYHTTRKPRDNERDGVDYYFGQKKPPSFVTIKTEQGGVAMAQNPVLIEERCYTTMNNGVVDYYTTIDCVKEDYYICAPSIEQLASYLKYFGSDKIIVVEIGTEIKTRIKRVLDKRTKTDQDVYELCRRVVQEKIDWEKAHYEDIIKNQLQHYLYIDNTVEADFQKNADKIFEYIKEQFHKA